MRVEAKQTQSLLNFFDNETCRDRFNLLVIVVLLIVVAQPYDLPTAIFHFLFLALRSSSVHAGKYVS